MELNVGTVVRIYYDNDIFDEGTVIRNESDEIDVDFYDWISRWSSPAQFVIGDCYGTKDFMVPTTAGKVIAVFRSNTK
jgi:hypothetical protein